MLSGDEMDLSAGVEQLDDLLGAEELEKGVSYQVMAEEPPEHLGQDLLPSVGPPSSRGGSGASTLRCGPARSC